MSRAYPDDDQIYLVVNVEVRDFLRGLGGVGAWLDRDGAHADANFFAVEAS
jgi:hypothetical protein